jgi:HTH-type transcriptional regulator, competence development regulator
MAESALGKKLYGLRQVRGLSLKTAAEPAGISPAYLQKLERGLVKSPSPHVLYGLSEVLEVPYPTLMQLAGYIVPSGDEEKVKPGNVLAYALSSENITEEEASELARYLAFIREERG